LLLLEYPPEVNKERSCGRRTFPRKGLTNAAGDNSITRHEI
jgi:hypothetical protein